MIRFLFALLLIVSLKSETFCQDYQMQISSVVNKLGDKPSATFAIVEDNQGFIWFGTIDGLYRFDGNNYKIFRKKSDNQNSISSNVIWGMDIDKKGIIWIATEGGGLDAFDPRTETFKNYHYTGSKKNEISGNSLWSVLVDSKENVWIGVAGSGVDKIDTKTGKITHFKLLNSDREIEQEQKVRCLIEDKNGLIWAGFTQGGVSVIDPAKGLLKRYFNTSNKSDNLSNNMPYDLLLDSDNNIWVTTFGGGVLKLNRELDKFQPINPINTNISNLSVSIKERIPGEFWIATENGLSIYDSKTKISRNLRQNSYNNQSISENRLRKIYVDSKGIVWIGTESGVERFVVQNNFKTFNINESFSRNGSNIVKAIVTNEENFWIGFINNGLLHYSKKTNSTKRYLNINPDAKINTISNINALFYDTNNNLWISDWNCGLLKYNPQKDGFVKVSNAYFEKNRLSDNRIQKIMEGSPGILWIGTEGGLNRYDIEKDEFIWYKHQTDKTNCLSSNSIQSQAMVFDKDSNLWIGTWAFGLNKMEFTDKERINANFKQWKHELNDSNSLSNNNVISLLYDTTALWIGTFGGGLCRLDLQSEKFTNFTTENGLANNIIFAIFKDKNGNLWLSTDHGISMFNQYSEKFYNYAKEDGLQDNHFFWGAAHKSKEGIIYFGGIEGVNSFIPEKVKPDTRPVSPIVVDIKLFNKSINHERFNLQSDEVQLYYYENFISFEFAALDYSEPQNNQYKYKLDGFDQDWIFNNNFNLASYTNLPPGDYTFMLKAANRNGIWGDKAYTLKVVVIPPWWKTWIARSLFVIFVVGFLYSGHRLRINMLKKKKRKLEHEVNERTIEISRKNNELKQKIEETLAQEEEIREQAEELKALSDKLKSANKSLSLKVKARTSELEEALGKAEDAQKLISSFLTNLSHEIRTPLNAIMGFSQLLTNAEDVSSIKDQYVDIIEQNVNNLLTQIDNIMNVAKLHTGQYKLKNSEFSLSNLFKETYNEFKSSRGFSDKELKIKILTDDNLILLSDRGALKKILYNLVENAIKFTDQGFVEFGFKLSHSSYNPSKIYIISKNTSLKLKIFVIDTGIGITQNEQQFIFDAFRKIESNKQKLYRGSGVGLSLVKNLTEKLNGIITLHSKPEIGTTITLEFSIAEI